MLAAPSPRKRQVTLAESPDLPLDTQWGSLLYREWCRKESERIQAHARRAFVAPLRAGRVAVFVEL